MGKVISLFFIIFGLFPMTVQAGSSLNVTYGIYMGGIHVVDIKGIYDITDQDYALEMDLRTRGVLGKLAPWSGQISSTGHYKGDLAVPSSHKFASTWRKETETNSFTFSRDGALEAYKRIEENGKIIDRMPESAVYADGATDMLTALLRVMDKTEDDNCGATVPATDGKRRFDMVFRHKGQEIMKANRYSVFSGKALICDIEIVPVAGKWRDKPRGWMSIQDQAKGEGQLPRIWFGEVNDDLPPIPVRFEIKTSFGTLIMHLRGVK